MRRPGSRRPIVAGVPPCADLLRAGAIGLVIALTGCAALPGAVQAPPASATATSGAPATSVAPTPSPSASVRPDSPVKPERPVKPTDRRSSAQRNRAFTVDGIPVISKQHPINAGYRRSSVTAPYGRTRQAQAALGRMIAAARAKGVRLRVRSGYRSYAEQAQILRVKIRQYGSESLARRYNAAPGRSEHHTGLAVDLWDGVTWGVGVRNTRAGRWLWANAWRCGFILRYPAGKERITGYAFEPWHYRYVGTGTAKAFGPTTTRTLEEYLGLA